MAHAQLHIGCCGWSYLNKQEFAHLLNGNPSSKLEVYARLYDTVEINSTFYAIPRVTTAEKWRRDSRAVNQKFEFAVKAFQGITHRDRFGSLSEAYFANIAKICSAVESRIILFQSPPNFHPLPANIGRMRHFFAGIDRSGYILAWEPRGRWYDDPQAILDVCSECRLIHCVDPLRNEALSFGNEGCAYFRLHGFGKPTMYNYQFSGRELEELKVMIDNLPQALKHIYVMFNNAGCYADAGAFIRLMEPVS